MASAYQRTTCALQRLGLAKMSKIAEDTGLARRTLHTVLGQMVKSGEIQQGMALSDARIKIFQYNYQKQDQEPQFFNELHETGKCVCS